MGDPRAVAERWTRALSEHNLEVAVSCFDPDYADEAPARRGDSVRGPEHVRRNVEAPFLDVPDLRAEILSSVVDADAVWMEWRMQGTRSNGTPFEFACVNIFGVHEDRFASLPGVGHVSNVEAAERFDAEVRALLRSVQS